MGDELDNKRTHVINGRAVREELLHTMTYFAAAMGLGPVQFEANGVIFIDDTAREDQEVLAAIQAIEQKHAQTFKAAVLADVVQLLGDKVASHDEMLERLSVATTAAIGATILDESLGLKEVGPRDPLGFLNDIDVVFERVGPDDLGWSGDGTDGDGKPVDDTGPAEDLGFMHGRGGPAVD